MVRRMAAEYRGWSPPLLGPYLVVNLPERGYVPVNVEFPFNGMLEHVLCLAIRVESFNIKGCTAKAVFVK
ncbi:MAG: hypothetical protein A4E65_01152 [Syntrophorhabdus sp. PtaU1.Bin153]|nr:MAG: hypothetical protein A4E65_01152 [Syntrophorhabdus sp. PtaU1.Bin153]